MPQPNLANTLKQALLLQTVNCIKLGIAHDLYLGLIPANFHSLQELSEHTDINTYGGFDQPDLSEALMEIKKEAHALIDEWLRA